VKILFPNRISMTSINTHSRQGLTVICIAAFLVPFMGSALNLALPEIGKAFSLNAVMLTWLATVYLISTAVFQIPFARIADIVGRKKIFVCGVALFSLSCFLCAFARSGFALLALRFVSGIGSSMMMSTNIAILSSLFPPEKRGKALGINVAVVYAALAVGPFFGGILTYYFGWQSIFYGTAGAGIVVLVLTHIFLRSEWIESRGEPFDTWGALLYGTALAALIYGFSSLPALSGFLCLAAGVGLFVYFYMYERRHQFPVFNVQLFSKNRSFALSSLAALINYAATAAIAFMLSLYLQYVRGLNPQTAGLILISQACVQSVFSLIAGSLSGRMEPSKMATMGMSIIVAGLCGLIFISTSTPYWVIIGLLVCLGVGFGMFSSPNTNVIMSSVEKKQYSQASATTGTMRLAGQAFSMGIAGMCISFYIGSNDIAHKLPEFLQSMRMTCIIFALLCVVGVYASMARIEKKKQGTAKC
jgi:MFS family permease